MVATAPIRRASADLDTASTQPGPVLDHARSAARESRVAGGTWT
jgi:hypothetical protein